MISNPNYDPANPTKGNEFITTPNGLRVGDVIYGQAVKQEQSYILVNRIIDSFVNGSGSIDKLYNDCKGYRWEAFGVKVWHDSSLDWLGQKNYERLKNMRQQWMSRPKYD